MDNTGCELSAKKNQYLKFVYLEGGAVKTTTISRHFDVAPSTVTRALGDLEKAGYITGVRYRGFCLTPFGEDYARFLVRRHRILALMFTRSGLCKEDACRQADLVESKVSRSVVDTICASLGHPTMSTCGRIEPDPIHCCPVAGVGERFL
ncbi:MAG: metal-dependent transcriptional regulator [Methanospirillaceae archaeon]|nr:metal-dependent transcriptional regulator [Methanospirillaceae archaeon]